LPRPMRVGWRDVDRQRDAVLVDAQVNLDAVDLLAAIEATAEAARGRPAGSLTRQLSACGQRKGAVDDDSRRLRGITAGQVRRSRSSRRRHSPSRVQRANRLNSVLNGISQSWPMARHCRSRDTRSPGSPCAALLQPVPALVLTASASRPPSPQVPSEPHPRRHLRRRMHPTRLEKSWRF
jgi:hypothetical protein